MFNCRFTTYSVKMAWPKDKIEVTEKMYINQLYKNYNPSLRSMSFSDQVLSGKISSPSSLETLHFSKKGALLTTESGSKTYPILGNIPILLSDPKAIENYANSSDQMIKDYDEYGKSSLKIRLKKFLLGIISKDYRTPESIKAHQKAFGNIDKNSVCLAIGGGPSRTHPAALNLNIGPFKDVDIVADAHDLPYKEGVVDVITCEEVLEHIKNPIKVVEEMFRVLKPGGVIYASTPFMISYHGYPHHYQNFTLSGHEALFTDRGFIIESSGTCIGSFFAILNMIGFFIAGFSPKWFDLNRHLAKIWSLICIFLNPIEILFRSHKNSAHLAHSTFILGKKP